MTQQYIFKFWAPLASQWFLMCLEGPFLAAVIARLQEPKFNLAAYGVAFAIALLLESPVIFLLSASTALVTDRVAYLRLRRFTYALNAGLTVLLGIFLLPALFRPFAVGVLGLPEPVASITHAALVPMLVWPGAIGYRRFYHGVLIRTGFTRRVAAGTAIRVATMATVSVALALLTRLDGALVGTGALAVGVTVESLATRIMSRPAVRAVLATPPEAGETPITYGAIWRFYYPLALTAMIFMGVNPVVTFFLGRGRLPVESLAVLPVVHALVFLFGSVGVGMQEAAIALMGTGRENLRELRRFSVVLGAAITAGIALLAFTPLRAAWFRDVSGLSPDLVRLASLPVQIMFLQPACVLILSLQRAILMVERRTRPITYATLLEVGGIVAGLATCIHGFGWVGVYGAAVGYVAGRVMSVLYLALAVASRPPSPGPSA